ncbi:MAG: histidinol-phosphate transaminase [Nitrospinota bacterium]|nr:histidinol-phosphate transaminase [Nitrospinota bacterium]
MSSVKLADLVRSNVQSLKGYQVENACDAIQMHANENPFPPSADLMGIFRECLQETVLNRYPDPACRELKHALAKRTGSSVDHLVIGNGSDELIQLILQIFCKDGDRIVFPDPAFGMYSIIAQGMGLSPQPFPLDDQWDFSADKILTSLAKSNARVIFFGYPNNPTGNCFSTTEIQEVIENFSGIVVVDEAYYDFSKKTLLGQMKDHNNLIILRSLSKIGLAGLRVGYGLAEPFIIKQLDKVRLPYNSNSLSQRFAEKVLQNFTAVDDQIHQIVKERQRLSQALSNIDSLTVFPTDANFILFRVSQDATTVFNQLLERGILVRDLSSHPRLHRCLRVTVGSPQENNRFLDQVTGLCEHIQLK